MSQIEIRRLHKCFGEGNACAWALNGVDLEITAGSYVALEGRSGAGKTTLLNCIGALETPSSGDLRVDGVALRGLAAEARAAFRLNHIGFVFQAYNLMQVLDARENVAYVLQLKGRPRREALATADQWLERVGLGDYRRRRPAELSGGQQQRVAVARALATGADIVLADEPTANLDTATAAALIRLMRRLNQESRTTFLISSHDPAVIRSAPRVVTLSDGRILADTEGAVNPATGAGSP